MRGERDSLPRVTYVTTIKVAPNGQVIENGQTIESADGQIIQHQVDNGGSVIKRIQQPGGAIVTIKTKGEFRCHNATQL